MKISDYSKKRIKKLKEIYNDYVREEDKELIRLTKEVDRLNNIINEFDKWLLGEKMLFYRSSDNERLIRYGETRNKWLELKGSDKE